MTQSIFHEKFNNSIVTAVLFSDLSLSEKERKIQKFINENEERYDLFCDNINHLFMNKDVSVEMAMLYLTIDGFSFISSSAIEQHESCFPVLTINKYSPFCSDISMYVELALNHFASYCACSKNAFLSQNISA